MNLNPGDLWKRWLVHDLIGLRDDSTRSILAEGGSSRAVVVERFMFMTAYVMRKLTENDELTVEILRSRWPAQEFKCSLAPPHPKCSESPRT